MKLAASMIVRNEMGRYLDIAIPHLLSFCDEVRVLDDDPRHEDDGTREYLGSFDRVHVYPNTGFKFFEHESMARNKLLDWTFAGKPDYVLSIDADEFVGSPEIVRECMVKGKRVYTLQMEEVWGCNEHSLALRVDGHWGPRKCPILWKCPAKWSNEWWIPERKLACGREPLAVRRGGFEVSGSSVYHFGWTRVSERAARAERYFIHDQGKFHQDRHLQSILWGDDQVLTAGAEWPSGLESVRVELVRRCSE